MTASAINPLTSALPGLAGAGNGQAVGPLAGFEALLAALFGDADIAGVQAATPDGTPINAAPQLPAAQPAPVPILVDFDVAAGESDDASTGATASASEADTSDHVLATADVLAAVLAVPAPPPQPVQETVAAAGGDPPAWGQHRAPGAPAAPALANANARAGLEAKPAAAAGPTTPPGPSQAAVTPASAATVPGPAAPPQLPAAATGMENVAAAPVAEEPQPAAIALPASGALDQANARQEITKAAEAPPAAPSKTDKDRKKAVSGRTGDSEVAKADNAPRGGAPAPVAAAADGKATDAVAKAPRVDAQEQQPRELDLPETSEHQTGSPETRAADQASHTSTPAAHAVRGAPETVASLAAQIIKKLDSRSTRFDVELDPAGLGKVDVRVEIGANGRVSAALSFENPQAAADLKSRSGELQRALEQAGFDLSGGLSFDTPGDRGQGRQDWSDNREGGFRGRAFQQAMEAADEADLAATSGQLRLRRGVTAGVDVRI